MIAYKPPLVSLVPYQYRSLMDQVERAEDYSDLEQVQSSLDLVAPTWRMLGKGVYINRVHQAIAERAGKLILQHEERLIESKRFSGLWDATQDQISHLYSLVEMN